MSKLLENKVYKICSTIIEWIVMMILIILIVLVAVQKFSDRGSFFGYRIYTIISGSMIPTYDVGDTLLIKEMSSDNIEIGDAVTYLGDGGGMNGKIITHQVVSIEFDEDGKYLFHTKGIANNIEDPVVSQDQVLGKVIHKFMFLSLFGRITTSMPLIFTFVTIPLAIIIALEIVKLVYKKEEDGKNLEELLEENEKMEDTKEEEKKEEIPEEEIKEEEEATSEEDGETTSEEEEETEETDDEVEIEVVSQDEEEKEK